MKKPQCDWEVDFGCLEGDTSYQCNLKLGHKCRHRVKLTKHSMTCTGKNGWLKQKYSNVVIYFGVK